MRVYPVFLSNQGCPHRCLFCNQIRSSSCSDLLTKEALWEKLDRMLPEVGEGEIAFFGGTFTFLPESLQSTCLAVAADFILAGRASGVRLSTRPDGLSQERLEVLAGAGVTTIEIGCQSFDDRVLGASRRGHCANSIRDAVERCRRYDLQLGLQLMPGLPGSDADEAMLSLSQALLLRPDFLRVYPTLVLQGTELAELWAAGEYHPWSLEQAVAVCAEMLLLCREAGVPVIRLGLQQDSFLERNLLAGPHHPAFGQLVRSRLWRRAVMQAPSSADVRVNPRDLSDALGHRAENRHWLRTRRPHQAVRSDSGVAQGQIAVGTYCWSLDELARKTG